MSKLSPSLKALINAPFARPGPCAAPAASIRGVYQAIAREATQRRLGTRPWLAISAAATFTLNSPDSLSILHSVATAEQQRKHQQQEQQDGGGRGGGGGGEGSSTAAATAEIRAAEFIREVGLKCISFNGIPRTINCLNAFRASLPERVSSGLATRPSRAPTPRNVDAIGARGRRLWDSIYAPFEDKLVDKLAAAHPDLPVVILNSHYGALLSDPPRGGEGLAAAGRVLTSLVAISCLRAQTGVGPQVLSHVFGLRKAVGDGTFREDEGLRGEEMDEKESEEAVRWLAGDEGGEWILRTVDSIAEALGGSNFARGAKL